MSFNNSDKLVDKLFKKHADFTFLNNTLIDLEKSGLDFKNKYNLEVLLMLIYPTSLSKKEIKSFIDKYEMGINVFTIEIKRKIYKKNKYNYCSTCFEIKRP